MPVFGSTGPSSSLPVDLIRSMRAQGMDNNQIIQTLQRDGYSSTAIFDAMNLADMPSFDSEQGAPASQPRQFSQEMSPSPEQSMPAQQPMRFQPGPSSPQYSADVSTEELVEAIIDEKWEGLEKDLAKIVEWKNQTNNRVLALEQKFEDLKQQFDKLHSALISKIDDYDKNIMNVGAEVKAMEKTFSKMLPVFSENVAELGRLAKDIKKPSKK